MGQQHIVQGRDQCHTQKQERGCSKAIESFGVCLFISGPSFLLISSVVIHPCLTSPVPLGEKECPETIDTNRQRSAGRWPEPQVEVARRVGWGTTTGQKCRGDQSDASPRERFSWSAKSYTGLTRFGQGESRGSSTEILGQKVIHQVKNNLCQRRRLLLKLSFLPQLHGIHSIHQGTVQVDEHAETAGGRRRRLLRSVHPLLKQDTVAIPFCRQRNKPQQQVQQTSIGSSEIAAPERSSGSGEVSQAFHRSQLRFPVPNCELGSARRLQVICLHGCR